MVFLSTIFALGMLPIQFEKFTCGLGCSTQENYV